MRMALRNARIRPEDVDYVNAHASSTGLGDAIETRALKLAFGEDKVQRPATAKVRSWLTEVSEDGLVSAAGLFQRVGQDSEAGPV